MVHLHKLDRENVRTIVSFCWCPYRLSFDLAGWCHVALGGTISKCPQLGHVQAVLSSLRLATLLHLGHKMLVGGGISISPRCVSPAGQTMVRRFSFQNRRWSAASNRYSKSCISLRASYRPNHTSAISCCPLWRNRLASLSACSLEDSILRLNICNGCNGIVFSPCLRLSIGGNTPPRESYDTLSCRTAYRESYDTLAIFPSFIVTSANHFRSVGLGPTTQNVPLSLYSGPKKDVSTYRRDCPTAALSSFFDL